MPASIKSLFQNFHTITTDASNSLWNVTFSTSDLSSVIALLELYDIEIEKAKHETLIEIKIGTNLCKDIIELQKQFPAEVDELEFLQFKICNQLLNILIIKKLSNFQFDWITNSLSNEISIDTQRDFFPYRIVTFASCGNPFVRMFFKQDFHLWTKNIFYYCRTSGGHKELINTYLNEYYGNFMADTNIVLISPDHILAIGEIQSLAFKNNLIEIVQETSSALMYYYNRIPVPDLLYYIAFQFSCIGSEYTPHNRSEWCKIIEEKYSKYIIGHFWLHLLINKYAADYLQIKHHLPELDLAIEKYHDFNDVMSGNFHEKKYEVSTIFTLFGPMLNSLFHAGDISTMSHIFKIFFLISDSDYTKSNIAILVPNALGGALYSKQGATQQLDGDPLVYFPEFVESYNRFLGSTHAINDDLNIPIILPPRQNSVPSPNESDTFEKIITDHFLLKDSSFLNDATSYFLYGSFQIPLQAILVKNYGIAIPIVQSFVDPLQQRKIRSVLLWQGDCLLSETECDTIQEIFEKSGIKVVRLNWHESNKADFINNYRQDNYDLVWISCHGEFNHYKPQDSFLVLNQKIDFEEEDNRITYEELNTELSSKLIARRLLVLNACDGATTSLTNSPASIGLGASLINKHQSLISHQWPIDDLAGAIYGTLLSHFLSIGKSYQEAYKDSVTEFLKGKEYLIEFIATICKNEELIERIKYKSDWDLSLIYYWGSISFIE